MDKLTNAERNDYNSLSLKRVNGTMSGEESKRFGDYLTKMGVLRGGGRHRRSKTSQKRSTRRRRYSKTKSRKMNKRRR
jgi:hypothetical protein